MNNKEKQMLSILDEVKMKLKEIEKLVSTSFVEDLSIPHILYYEFNKDGDTHIYCSYFVYGEEVVILNTPLFLKEASYNFV